MEDAVAAVGGGTSAVEEGHTLDAVESGTLAVEGVANLLVMQTRQQWSWSAYPCWQTVWTCFHYTACPSCPFGPKVAFLLQFLLLQAGNPLAAFSLTFLACNCLIFRPEMPVSVGPWIVNWAHHHWHDSKELNQQYAPLLFLW